MSDPDKNFDPVKEVHRVLELEGNAILHAASRVQASHKVSGESGIKKAINLLAKALEEGGKIVITGIGKSGKVGEKIAATLSSTGSTAVFLHPTEGLHGDLGIVQTKDVILAISYSGDTEELIKLLPSLKKIKTPIVGMGGKKDSRLGQECEAWLDVSVAEEACPHNLAPTTSTTLCLAMGDALAVALMQLRGFDERDFALNHPGGSIGKKLDLQTKPVSELMVQKDRVGYVSPDASMNDVVLKLTETKHGAVLVGDEFTLKGMITDGDLRRALSHKESFFNLTAKNIMTSDPIVVTPETMVIKALELMENRPSQIACLPVVELGSESKKWVGLLRLHDIVRSF